MRPSFYVLELSVAPGGARKHDEYLYNNLEDIERALRKDLTDSSQTELALTHGETIKLRVYNHNRLTRAIDLLPYLTIQVPGFPLLGFHSDGALAVDADALAAEGGMGGLEDRLERAFEVAFTPAPGREVGIAGIEVTIDWDAARVPPLVAPLLAEGAKVIVYEPSAERLLDQQRDDDDDDDDDDDKHHYGYNDLEFGTDRE